MVKVLIPRSDSISAKVVEPSDFEEMFSSDFMNDYVQTGFNITAGSGLAANISTGKARVKGLFVENDASATKTGLSASTTNYIYITLTRDSNSEAESWDFTSNTSGSTPTDSMVIGRAITNGSGVTSTNTTGRILYPLNLTESLKKTSPFNSASTGKILYYNGSVWAQLPIGTSGHSLKSSGGIPAWQLDNFSNVTSSPTAGDILYYNGTSWTKLPKGSDGKILELTSGLPAWEQGRLKSMSAGTSTTFNSGLGSSYELFGTSSAKAYKITLPTSAIGYKVTSIEFKVYDSPTNTTHVKPIVLIRQGEDTGGSYTTSFLGDMPTTIYTTDAGVVKTMDTTENENIYFGGSVIYAGMTHTSTQTGSYAPPYQFKVYSGTSGITVHGGNRATAGTYDHILSHSNMTYGATGSTSERVYFKVIVQAIGSL